MEGGRGGEVQVPVAGGGVQPVAAAGGSLHKATPSSSSSSRYSRLLQGKRGHLLRTFRHLTVMIRCTISGTVGLVLSLKRSIFSQRKTLL